MEEGKGGIRRSIDNSYQDFGWVVNMNMIFQGGEVTQVMEVEGEPGSGNGGAHSFPTRTPQPVR